MPYANSKGADQSAHPRSLTSAFFSSLPSVICMYTCYSCTRDEAHILSLTMTAGPYISVPMLPAVTMEFGVAFVLESLV